ncbi:MotA/TolQ/ExbB proton channel family protein, partial [Francisellaceae bacterium]|nr:MotA/TolQ/ExbB proton channel family protein [Francisellaceae bacterium]
VTLSILLGIVCIERIITLYSQPIFSNKKVSRIAREIEIGNSEEVNQLVNKLNKQAQSWIEPFMSCSRKLAEEEVGLLLYQKRQKLLRPMAWLNLFAVISPMVGLLGTIWSMSHSFAALAESMSGQGLQNMIIYLSEAMFATAFGILLALMSLTALYTLRHKAEIYLAKCESVLNKISIAIARREANGN